MQQDKINLCDEFSLMQVNTIVERVLIEAASFSEFQQRDLLKEKKQLFMTDYKEKSSEFITDHLKQPYRLGLVFKTDPKVQILNAKTQQKLVKVILSPPNIFLYKFELPCSYKMYEQMIRTESIQKKLDDIISSYEVIKQIGLNGSMRIQLIYLSYKRVMIISPREFIYIRIFFKDQNVGENNVYWIVTYSVPYEKNGEKTRAEIIFTAQKIEENTKDANIKVKVYSEIDMKTVVKAEMARSKGCSQIKKYIHKLYEYSKSLK